jgi:hypothetical protein
MEQEQILENISIFALGNKIHKESIIISKKNSDRLRLFDKNLIEKNVIVRSDLGKIDMGQYCIIKENSILRPPLSLLPKKYY